MQSFLHYLWSVSMAFLLVLFPYFALGHLGSALKTGSGALTKFTFADNVICCTFKILGEGKPPILHNHVRVSREPQSHQRRMFKFADDFDGTTDPLKIKSPSYQHKILQFHSNAQTSSSHGHDFMPLKHITNQYSSTNSMPIYPVASKFGKVDTSRLVGSTSTGSLSAYDDDDNGGGDSWEMYSNVQWKPNLLPKSEQPTFTPFIGARALTNIPLFFKHLRENIHSVYGKQREPSSNVEEIEAAVQGNEDEEDDKSSETQDMKIATPTRRGYSSNSEPSPLTYGNADPDTMAVRDSRASDLYTLGRRISTESAANDDASELDGETKELLHFLGHGRPEYPKANNYNPAWLFTNLGLGKRKRSDGGRNSLNKQ